MRFLQFEKDLRDLYLRLVRTKNPLKKEILRDKFLEERKKLEENLTYWQKVELARHPSRPRSSDLIPLIFDEFLEIKGDRCQREDRSVIAGLGRVGNEKFVVVAQEKSRRKENILSPAGIRKGIRMLKMSSRFLLPVVTLVDNPGTFPGFEREEEGMAYWISTMLHEMYMVPTPTLGVVIGEGGSGGAIAFSLADRILMLKHTIFMVIAPEASSTIIYRTEERSEEVARRMKILSEELFELGLIDEVIDEPPGGAHWDPEETSQHIREAILRNIAELRKMGDNKRLERRKEKYLSIGVK